MDDIGTFKKTHQCPKCANSYFSLYVKWMDTYIKRTYTCENCLWSFVEMANCTSPSSVQAPSLPNPSVVSVQPVQSK